MPNDYYENRANIITGACIYFCTKGIPEIVVGKKCQLDHSPSDEHCALVHVLY